MLPMLSLLTRPQRVGYLLSIVWLSVGWLLLLTLLLEWSSLAWSRPVLALQAAALIIALRLRPHMPVTRLVVYALILAGSIYLWDTSLPPPNFPTGWPREFVPRLVLVGLLVDGIRTLVDGRRSYQGAMHGTRDLITLDVAAHLLGVSSHVLRTWISQRKCVITVDASGQEYLSFGQLRTLRRERRPAWWHLYAWLVVMNCVLFFVEPFLIPATWRMGTQVAWCVLTFGGMSVWVWWNQHGLKANYRAQQSKCLENSPGTAADAGRTVPLTDVQARFLAVMNREQDPDA